MKKIYLLFAILSIWACNSEPKLKARCYVRFLEEENKLQTKIEVREINQKEIAALKLDEVRFNEGAMEHHENQVVGNYYQSENTSGYPSSGFEFNVKNGKTEAIIQFESSIIKNPTVKEIKISKSKGFTICWEGKPLVKGEDLTITITDTLGVVAQAIVKGATAKTEAVIPNVMYSGLKTGKAVLFLVKTALPLPKTKDIEATTEVGYYTKPQAIEIVD